VLSTWWSSPGADISCYGKNLKNDRNILEPVGKLSRLYQHLKRVVYLKFKSISLPWPLNIKPQSQMQYLHSTTNDGLKTRNSTCLWELEKIISASGHILGLDRF